MNSSIPLFETLLVKDSKTLYCKKIYEITCYNQFGDEFEGIIKQLNLPQSICGYSATGNTELIAKRLKEMSSENLVGQIEVIIDEVTKKRIEICEKVAKFIQSSRRNYIKCFAHEFKNESERKNYLKDWVATYEMSDYLKSLDQENILFWRNVAYDHPNEMEKMQHEELSRLPEELAFKGQGYFIDYRGMLLSLDQFKNDYWDRLSQEEKNRFGFAIDLLGHFVSAIMIDQTIILVDTTLNNYIDTQSFKDFVRYFAN